jgi:hypothetical protein
VRVLCAFQDPEGRHRLGVGGRQYSGTLGKTGNCQIGVSVQLATDTASAAVNWRLFCPASWDDTTISTPDKAAGVRQRRDRAGIPDDVRHREK